MRRFLTALLVPSLLAAALLWSTAAPGRAAADSCRSFPGLRGCAGVAVQGSDIRAWASATDTTSGVKGEFRVADVVRVSLQVRACGSSASWGTWTSRRDRDTGNLVDWGRTRWVSITPGWEYRSVARVRRWVGVSPGKLRRVVSRTYRGGC